MIVAELQTIDALLLLAAGAVVSFSIGLAVLTISAIRLVEWIVKR